MFNLDQSIAQWRRQMRTGGVKSPVPLDELESHLREDIAEQARSGVGVERGFEIAVARMGQAGALKNEFKKTEKKLMKRTLLVLAGILCVAFGAAFIMPAVAWYHDHGAMPLEHFGFLMLGVAIVAVGVGVAIFGFKKAKA